MQWRTAQEHSITPTEVKLRKDVCRVRREEGYWGCAGYCSSSCSYTGSFSGGPEALQPCRREFLPYGSHLHQFAEAPLQSAEAPLHFAEAAGDDGATVAAAPAGRGAAGGAGVVWLAHRRDQRGCGEGRGAAGGRDRGLRRGGVRRTAVAGAARAAGPRGGALPRADGPAGDYAGRRQRSGQGEDRGRRGARLPAGERRSV